MNKGSVFLYPCAGSDVVEPIDGFGAQMDTFVFVDIRYRFDRFQFDLPAGWHEEPASVRIDGPLRSRTHRITDGKTRYRDIEPAWRRSQCVHAATGRTIELVFRRGFGQYALHELPDESLGVFFHRGDSSGEGGSGVIFLGNRRMRHAPISNQMDVIRRKLACPALIVSDGSNTRIRELGAASRGAPSVSSFLGHGLKWERVRTLKRNAVVWRVAPAPG